jgi:phage-related protein
MSEVPRLRPVIWVGSSRTDLRAFSEAAQDHVGYALYGAQCGGRHCDTKPLSGFGGAGVVEIVQGLSRRCVPRCLHAAPQRDAPARLREAERIAREKPS